MILSAVVFLLMFDVTVLNFGVLLLMFVVLVLICLVLQLMFALLVYFQGQESISDYAISFHYIPPPKMYALEYFVYHLQPYGIHSASMDLNQKKT